MTPLDIRNIIKNIEILEDLENRGLLDTRFALKIALMECCGWIEEKMANIIFEYIDRKIKNFDLNNELKIAISKKNYSFRYKDFRDKLVSSVGELEVIKIEKGLKKRQNVYFDFDHFKTILSGLKTKRDQCAHTFMSNTNTTITFFGFNEIKQKLKYINNGFKIIKQYISRR
jgi:hypothetical protein